MAYFDIVASDEAIDAALAKRLGFKRVFAIGKDVGIINAPEQADPQKRSIVKSKSTGTLMRSLKSPGVIGVLVDDSTIIRNLFESARENGKAVFLDASALLYSDRFERIRNARRMSRFYGACAKAGTTMCLVTLARDRHHLLSSGQMLELAEFIGAKGLRAKALVSALGDYA